MILRRFACMSVISVVALAACGGQGGEKVRPKDFTAKDALGGPLEPCTGDPKLASPLLVDMDDDARVNLEAAMNKGVVVVGYDCATIKVLPECHLGAGKYAFERVSRREKVVRMKGADDLKVNLPMSAGKLGGEIQSGRTIDLGMVTIGRRSTVVSAEVKADDLVGTCEGATHVLAHATVGAFSLATGSAGKVAAIADLFKVGVTASSESSKSVNAQDGSLDACRAGDPDDEKMPADCRAPISVELHPIHGSKAAAKPEPAEDPAAAPPPAAEASSAKLPKEDKTGPDQNPCRTGYLFSGGICTKEAAEDGYLCDSSKHDECKAQCDKGNFGSCYNYGEYASYSNIDPIPYFQKACEGGHGDACDRWGRLVRPPYQTPGDPAAFQKAHDIFKKGCDIGSGAACVSLAEALDEDRNAALRDLSKSFHAWKRACSLGSATGCAWAAFNLADGKGVAKDPVKATELLDVVCASGNWSVCDTFISELRSGQRIKKDLERAAVLSKKRCEKAKEAAANTPRPEVDEGSTCETTADVLADLGRYDEAFKYAKKACDAMAPDVGHCFRFAKLTETGKGTKKDPAAAHAIYTKYCVDNELIDSLRPDSVCKKYGSNAKKGGAPKKKKK